MAGDISCRLSYYWLYENYRTESTICLNLNTNSLLVLWQKQAEPIKRNTVNMKSN